jgi:hypothetical protein
MILDKYQPLYLSIQQFKGLIDLYINVKKKDKFN